MYKLLLILLPLFSDTTATSIYFQGDYGSATMAIEGTSNAGFSIHAESVYDFQSKQNNRSHRLFGEAYYHWNQSSQNHFVENADYDMLYPYLTTDTIGGGLRMESYFFRGGYTMMPSSSLHRPFSFTLALSYMATQSYRSIDPRPKNKVADLSLAGKIGMAHNNYVYSFLIEAGRYKQNNDIVFYSELGETMIYHMVFPGQEYSRFSGANKSAYYHGEHIAGGVQVEPLQVGWVASAMYTWNKVTKELDLSTMLPIANLQQHIVNASCAYHQSQWKVGGNIGVNFRRGAQYIYGEAIDNTYLLLAKSPNYTENILFATLTGSYHLSIPFGKILFMGTIGGQYKMQNYVSIPSPSFAELATNLTSSTIYAQATFRYTIPISQKAEFFLQPLVHYTHYFASKQYTHQIHLQIGVIF